MIGELFLKPRLVGQRFDDHSIPLEVLKDLAVLEEMIVEVAKAEFRKEHPHRQRTPRGFTDGVALKLAAVEDGSAVAIILLSIASSLFPPENQRYFDQARDAVVGAIGAAEQNRSITEYLSEESLGYFDRLGRSLREGEAIEFTAPGCMSPARLTRETRRKLVLASSRVKELTDETTVRGSIPEVDQGDMTFELRLFDGRKVSAPMTAQHLAPVLEAFNAYRTGARVLVQGIGLFSRTEKLMGFESVEHVSVLDPLDVSTRLDDLRLLKDGWLEGRGYAPNSSGIDWLSDRFLQNYPEDLPLPFVYPTPEGGIRLEWSLQPHEITADIDLGTRRAVLHALNLDSDEEQNEQLNLDRSPEWDRLAGMIRRVAGDSL